MRCWKTPIAGFAVVLLVVSAGAALGAESIESLVKKVDAKLYYPQTQGMQSLQADVQSSLLQQRIQNTPEAKNVKLTFYWAQPYKARFALSGVPQSLQYEAGELERQLAMWSERLVPKPLALQLADQKCSLKEDEKTYTIDARTTAPGAFIWAMKYTIDKKSLLPTVWQISTDNWTADVHIQYEGMPTGQSYPKAMSASAEGTDVKIQLTHTLVGKFLLAESMSVTFTGGDGAAQTSTLKLSNHRINQPIPAGTFPAARQ